MRREGTRNGAPAGGPGPGPPSMHDEPRLLRVGAKLAHLFLHGRAARLERAGETAALFLEVVTALPDQIGGLALRLGRLLLRPLEPLLAVLAQELARFRPGLGRQEQRGGRAGDGAEEEPAQITRCVSTMLVRHVAPSFSGYFRSLETKTPAARFRPDPTLLTPRKEARLFTTPTTRAVFSEMCSTSCSTVSARLVARRMEESVMTSATVTTTAHRTSTACAHGAMRRGV